MLNQLPLTVYEFGLLYMTFWLPFYILPANELLHIITMQEKLCSNSCGIFIMQYLAGYTFQLLYTKFFYILL